MWIKQQVLFICWPGHHYGISKWPKTCLSLWNNSTEAAGMWFRYLAVVLSFSRIVSSVDLVSYSQQLVEHNPQIAVEILTKLINSPEIVE